MRTNRFSLLLLPLLLAIACGDDDVRTDSGPGADSGPGTDAGTPPSFTARRSGTLMNVDGTPSATGFVGFGTNATGMVAQLGMDFVQEMGPGDTELRLAMSDENVGDQIAADAANVSPAIGIIPNASTGTFTFDLPAGVDPLAFTHAIIWCPTAAVNFGVAELGTVAGTLANVEGTPSATGSITIAANATGGYTVSLGADFVQEMGPGDTEIRLAAGDGNVAEMIAEDAGSVSAALGIIPNAATGARSFDVSIPNLASYTHAIIWCPTAAVNFGAGAISAE